MSIEVSYAHAEQDARLAARLLAEACQRRWLDQLLWYGIVLIPPATFFGVRYLANQDVATALMAAAVALSLTYVLRKALSPLVAKKFSKALTNNPEASRESPFVVTAASDGVRLAGAGGEVFFRWQAVSGVIIAPEGVILCAAGGGYIVPHRAFGSAQAQADFVRFVRGCAPHLAGDALVIRR